MTVVVDAFRKSAMFQRRPLNSTHRRPLLVDDMFSYDDAAKFVLSQKRQSLQRMRLFVKVVESHSRQSTLLQRQSLNSTHWRPLFSLDHKHEVRT